METKDPIAVIKVGGDVVVSDESRKQLAQNLLGLHDEGWKIILLHGGGPQVNSLQERLGLPVRKVGGRRITGPQDLQVVKQAICGETNVDLVCALLQEGLPALGLHGASGALIQAQKRPPRVVSGSNNESIDFGEVGDVTGIRKEVLNDILTLGYLPVIATLGVNAKGRAFNINADTTCVQIARSLGAELLLLTTGVGGIFRDIHDPASRFPSITASEARALITDGVIQGGMIPKVEEALSVLSDGVKRIAVVGPNEVGSFRDIALGKGSYGTEIRP
jgi:acetylglutamate kinase